MVYLPVLRLYARIHYNFLWRRGVAQMVEQRSPKPRVVGSIPATPAIFVLPVNGRTCAEVVELVDTPS